MRVAIRVDSSRQIGTGHVRRMLAVAQALRAIGADVRFVSRDLIGHAAGLIRDHDFALHLLPAPDGAFAPPLRAIAHADWAGVPQERDALDTIDALQHFRPDWVMVDHYAFDAAWHVQVGNALRSRLAVVDDLADRPLAAAMVIDHNFHPDHRRKFAVVLEPTTTLLAGPRFAMLGPVYAQAPRHIVRAKVDSIGVFLGGVDAENHAIAVLTALDASGFAGTIEIASTRANPNLPALRDAVAARSDCSLTVDLPNLAEFFARHDLQIGAGGGAIWERCCIGAPTLCLICADNQRSSVPELADIGALVAHDLLNTASAIAPLAVKIAKLVHAPEQRHALQTVAMQLVDGRGSARIAEALIERRGATV